MSLLDQQRLIVGMLCDMQELVGEAEVLNALDDKEQQELLGMIAQAHPLEYALSMVECGVDVA